REEVVARRAGEAGRDSAPRERRGRPGSQLMAQASKYNADEIQVLEGLDPVRKRPGMYIGGTGKDGYHHLLWEVVDNSIDEVINKHASRVEVTLHRDGKSCTVEDNGRGIPIDTVAKLKKSALEVIFTKLHAGAKLDRGNS